jgi:uncharacterized protein YndB with AHSA1/START domain
MTDEETTFSHEVRIEAPQDVVFSYFTEPAKMARWMGVAHELDAVVGGVYQVDVNGRDVAMGEFLRVEPPSHVEFTWGWRDSAEVPPGSTTVVVDLAADGDATVVRFSHHGLPPAHQGSHARGWVHYLGRLTIAGAGGDPGPDTFVTSAPAPTP